jgi:LytS/YehU family sensor histidine kinase
LVLIDANLLEPLVGRFFPGALFRGAPSALGREVLDFSFYLWIFAFYLTCVSLMEAGRLGQERARRLAEADAAASAAQLAALRLQLSPHFLFNTLNAVSSLIVTGRHQAAELMIERLSDFLRSTLSSHWTDEVELEDELAALEAYLEIEAVRFPDRLTYVVDAPHALLGARCPSLILQPLAENAIKYAVAPSTSPVTLRIQARQEGKSLVLSVSDDARNGVGKPASAGTGVGLGNVSGRLRALYGEDAELRCTAGPTGFVAELRMPLALERPAQREPAAPRAASAVV